MSTTSGALMLTSIIADGRQLGDCCLTLSHDAFSDEDANVPTGLSRVTGEMKLTNALTDFMQLDRKLILTNCAKTLWQRITTGAWLDNPEALNYFFFTCYAVRPIVISSVTISSLGPQAIPVLPLECRACAALSGLHRALIVDMRPGCGLVESCGCC